MGSCSCIHSKQTKVLINKCTIVSQSGTQPQRIVHSHPKNGSQHSILHLVSSPRMKANIDVIFL